MRFVKWWLEAARGISTDNHLKHECPGAGPLASASLLSNTLIPDGFMGEIAERHFGVAPKALRESDPDHLVSGPWDTAAAPVDQPADRPTLGQRTGPGTVRPRLGETTPGRLPCEAPILTGGHSAAAVLQEAQMSPSKPMAPHSAQSMDDVRPSVALPVLRQFRFCPQARLNDSMDRVRVESSPKPGCPSESKRSRQLCCRASVAGRCRRPFPAWRPRRRG